MDEAFSQLDEEISEPERAERLVRNHLLSSPLCCASVLRSQRSTLIGRIKRDTVLSLVEIMMLLRQLSYAIKTQLKATKAPTRFISCLYSISQDPRYLSLCHKEPAKGKKCP